MKLSILVPVYNEEETILKVVNILESISIGDVDKEIVIVDDGSIDGTLRILEDIKNRHKVIFHDKNMGKGKAVRTAIENASGDVMVIQDADLEYDPNDIRSLLEQIKRGETEVVYGSRFLGKTDNVFTALPTHYIGNKILTKFTNLLYNCELTDMETCYKMFRKNVLSGVNLKARGFELEPEITSKILKKGFKIKEIPINYSYRTYEKGKKIGKIDGFKALYYLLKYRVMD